MMSRGLRVLKLADVDLQPLIATNGSLLGELVSV